MARSLNPPSNFIRRTSPIFRIDNLSVGMDTSLLKRGAIDRLDCRRTRPPNRPHRTLTIPRNVCSRSSGQGAHDPVETALTIPWILHDTRWKVPGVLDWSTGVYNPRVDVTQDTTTLYASDRDVFLFLVDDLNPIEAGRLPDGSPDLYFRGFYCWNSEVGAKTLGMASFYLRAVCQNRNLWGVEDFEEITIRHSKYAASRFAHEAAPALTRFANSSPMPFVNGVEAARERIVARSDDERTEFLRKRGFRKSETAKIIETVLAEEGRKPESVFDFVQGITAVARDKTHQDARLDLEARAKKLLDRAA